MTRIRNFFILVAIGLAVAGCVASKKHTSSAEAAASALTGVWRVEDIDQGGVIDYALVSVQFEENNRIAGSTGCNRYNGHLDTAGETFVVSQVASTRRACAPAVANQEQRFLAALQDTVRFDFETKPWLFIYDAAGKPRLKLIPMESSSATPLNAID